MKVVKVIGDLEATTINSYDHVKFGGTALEASGTHNTRSRGRQGQLALPPTLCTR